MNNVGVVVFAFGAPSGTSVNLSIGGRASAEAWKFSVPVFTQRDVPLHSFVRRERVSEREGKPPSTLKLARHAVAWAIQNQFTELRVVAAQPHLWRAVRDTKAAVRETGFKFLKVSTCEWNGQPESDLWFTRESTQLRGRFKILFWVREAILRGMPFGLYKQIVG